MAVILNDRGPRPGRSGKHVSAKSPERGSPTHVSASAPWERFVRTRHQRMHPPPMYDEGVRKFEKFGNFSFDPSDPFTLSYEETDTRPTSAAETDPEEEEEKEISQNAKLLGLRKFRFFDGCQRADKAFEIPRLPSCQASSPKSAREKKRHSLQILQTQTRPVSPPSSADKGATKRSMSPPSEKRRLKAPSCGEPTVLPAQVSLPMIAQAMPPSSSVEAEESLTISESMNGLVTSCKQARMNPVTTGIIRSNGEKLRLEYGCMTDMRAEAILHTLRASSSDVRDALLKSNGLTERGTKNLLSALPESVQKIDLSQNDLGHNDTWCHSFRRLASLRSLNVSDCELGDNITRTLCEALGVCLMLKALILSGNHIYKAAVAVATLVQASLSLEDLDVHWNHISGDSARELIRGIYENGQGAGRLRDLNISWNPIGKGGGEDACKLLAQVFSENITLRHVNLAKCELSARQCEILADGLKENTSILGMHLGGNKARMTARGFIVPLKSISDAAEGNSSPRSGTGEDPVDPVDLEWQRRGENAESSCPIEPNWSKNCWLCERWQETRIEYIPGISGPEVPDVWVYTSVDEFEQATKLTKFDSCLVTYFVCPPGVLRYIFQVGKELLPSRTAPIIYDIPTLTIRRLQLPGESEDDDQGAQSALVVKVNCLNTKVVVQREADELECICSVPRKIGEVKEDHPPSQWKAENSLFGPHDEALERRAFCEKCFELDWRNSRITSLIDDDSDRMQVKEILRAHYAEIKVLFGSLCSVEQHLVQMNWMDDAPEQQAAVKGPLTFGISLNEYTHMLVQHHILGADELSLHDADAQFMLAAAPTQESGTWAESTHKDGHLILRHGFFELLVRLALMRFRRDLILPEEPRQDEPRQKPKAKSANHALDILLNKHIMYPYPPMKYNFNCVQWRVDVLHTEEVETVLRKHMKTVIDPVFIMYSKKYPPRQGRFLQVEDWFDILDRLQVLPCHDDNSLRNTWDRSWVWQISIMSRADELLDQNHLLMSFAEFLEALGRLVGLLTARKRVVTGEEADKWDYGLGFYAPSYAFCTDKEQIMDKQNFAKLLDNFFRQDLAKVAAFTAKPSSAYRM